MRSAECGIGDGHSPPQARSRIIGSRHIPFPIPTAGRLDQIVAANPWLQLWGEAVPRVIKRVSIIVNVRCDRTGLWYDAVSSLATCCWPVVGRRSPRKTSTMTEGTNCRPHPSGVGPSRRETRAWWCGSLTNLAAALPFGGPAVVCGVIRRTAVGKVSYPSQEGYA
jgi:hypothetical protein